MTRLLTRVLYITGIASVTLMQVPCSTTEHGFSVLPNIGGTFNLGNPLASLTGLLGT